MDVPDVKTFMKVHVWWQNILIWQTFFLESFGLCMHVNGVE